MFGFLFGKKKTPSIEHKAATSGLNWRQSKPHLQLLSRFVYPSERKTWITPAWNNVLGESSETAINRFLSEQHLIPATLESKISCSLNTSDLKSLLKDYALPVSGNKEVLIKRLLAAAPDKMEHKVAHLELFECSTEARLIVDNYLKNTLNEKRIVEKESLSCLRTKNFKKAIEVINNYESHQVFPRGVGIDWSKKDTTYDVFIIETIFSSYPKILDGLEKNEWEPLRMATAMMHLWGTNSVRQWLPSDFIGVSKFNSDTAARMLLFYAQGLRDIAGFRLAGIKEVKISRANTSPCEICQKFTDKAMSIEKLPELPNPACIHQMGCRCIYEPVFDS